ncbi:MAG TPA: DUF4214 domain-containing protein [Telluria sp.]|nr:DUF4214 domain-containing protein [Telluria sp.]
MTTEHIGEALPPNINSVVLTGTPASDRIDGTSEADTLRGGDGDDQIDGREGPDLLYGELGDDYLTGGSGDDTIEGGDGNDRIDGGPGANRLYGQGGNDELTAYNFQVLYGSSLLDGGDGNDVLSSNAGDTVVGGAGADTFHFLMTEMPDLAPTVVDGGTGDDRFILPMWETRIEVRGGEGRDTYELGTAGRTGLVDVFDFKAGAGGDIIDVYGLEFQSPFDPINPFGAAGYLRAVQDGADLLLQYDRDGAAGTEYQFRTVVRLHGVDLDDITGDNLTRGLRIDGTTAGVVIEGTAGDDTLNGQLWNDRISGKGGNDRIDGETGDDWIDGGDGDDTLEGGAGSDSVFGGAGADLLAAREGNDTLDGGLGNDILYGDGPGTHLIRGGEGDDMLTGRDSGMTLDGGAGNDRIWFTADRNQPMESGTAFINGGDGNDRIEITRLSTPTLVNAAGGAGSDTFVLVRTAEVFTITDFAAGGGGDEIDLSQLLWSLDPDKNENPFASPRLLKLEQRGADTVLQFSHDGGPSGYVDVVVLKNTLAGSLTRANFFGGISPDGSLTGIERDGTAAADTMTGYHLADTLRGLGGNDHLSGYGGHDLLYGGDGADYLTGGAGDDTMHGGDGDDQISDGRGIDFADGGAGNDRISLNTDFGGSGTLNGGDGNDILIGGFGSETMTGGAGDDRLTGGSGLDFAVYAQPRAAYTVERVDGVRQIVDTGGTDGTDQLSGIERALFADGAVAFDVSGVGGKVYRLYQAAFARTPDSGGVGFWVEMGDRGVGMNTMAMHFMSSPEFAALYGGAPTNEALVRLFYLNALHRPADDAGLAFWTNVLDTGQSTAAAVLNGFSESEENIAAVAPAVANGFQYDPWF